MYVRCAPLGVARVGDLSDLTPFTVLPKGLIGQARDAKYVTPAVLDAITRSQTHVSATPTLTPIAAPPAGAIGVSLGAPLVAPSPTPAPVAPPTDTSQVSLEGPIAAHSSGMAKYYAPEPCPPLPIQPTQSSTYTWPDSLLDVALEPVPPTAPTSPQQPPPAAVAAAPSEPLFFSPSPPAALAPIPADSAAKRALSSMAMGRTLAEDLMDIEAGVPLPSLVDPVLRNPLVGNGDEIDDILFSHIRPLQGDALIRAAGVLPEELLPGPCAEVPAPPSPDLAQTAPTHASSAPPTQEPSYVTEPPVNTYDDPSLSQSLAHLAGLFPNASSETFTIVLDKVNGDLSAASAWMQSVTDITKAKGILVKTFPSAPEKEVESSLRHYKGDFLLSFYRLARSFEHMKEWNDLKYARSRGVMDIDTPAPDFIYDDPATAAYEWQWWQIAVSIQAHRVADDPEVVDVWNRLAGLSTATREITPRFVDYVYKLGQRNSIKSDFISAVKVLRAQPDFKAIEAIVGPTTPCSTDSPRDAATTVLQVLLSDRYISPPAAAWLAIRVSGSPSMYIAMSPLFLAFPKTRQKLWNDRNLHLAAWSVTNMKHWASTNSPTGSRISAADAKSAYSNVVPSAKGKEVYPVFSRVDKGKAPMKAKTRAQKRDAQEKKKKADVSAARLAKKGLGIAALIESERALMEEEKEDEE